MSVEQPASASAERRPAQLRTDLAVAALVAVFCLSGALISGASADEPNLTALSALVLIAECAPLVYRRRAPIVVLFATGFAAAVYGIADWPDPLVHLGVFVALATVVECCPRRVAVALWLMSVGFGVAAVLVAGDSDAVDVWVVVVTLLFAPLAGDHQRARAAYAAEVRANAERTAREHERNVRDARLAERAHLARELHDVVAHHVSMIVVQAEAGASDASVVGRPARSSIVGFDAIAETARRALGELRTLLTVLRAEGTPRAPTAPQPGLDRVDDLVRDLPRTGLHVALTVTGDRRPLAPAIDLSGYRVVQESLTNIVKHANARHADVSICYKPDRLTISVIDDGVGGVAGPGGVGGGGGPGGGRGLDGLRERVALLGGAIDTGRSSTGGFRVDVVLPLEV